MYQSKFNEVFSYSTQENVRPYSVIFIKAIFTAGKIVFFILQVYHNAQLFFFTIFINKVI